MIWTRWASRRYSRGREGWLQVCPPGAWPNSLAGSAASWPKIVSVARAQEHCAVQRCSFKRRSASPMQNARTFVLTRLKTMRAVRTLSLVVLLILAFPALTGSATAQPSQEKRIALVVGDGAYAKSPLATAANDAGLIAQTLQAAGFDVIGARDLDFDSLRKSFRDFLQKAEELPAGTVAVVYLAGYGVQLAGENYFIPVDFDG